MKVVAAVAAVLVGASLLAGCGKQAGTAATTDKTAPAAAADTKAKTQAGYSSERR